MIKPKQKTKTDNWKHMNEWLSDDDIINVLRKFKKRRFKVYFPEPIDFDEKTFGICKFDGVCKDSYESLRTKYDSTSIVFNTDTSDQYGSHWICMYFDIKNKIFYFFDSAGNRAPSEVKNLFNRFKREAKALDGSKIVFKENKIHHQYSNTECGVYCIYFILMMLKDTRHFETTFQQARIPDEQMFELRRKLFKF